MYTNNLHGTCLPTTFLTQTYIIPTVPSKTEYINYKTKLFYVLKL